MSARLTEIVRSLEGELMSILMANTSIVEKTVNMRRLARRIASEYFNKMHYSDIEEFNREYEKGTTPLTELEGEGLIQNGIIILKKCPMAPLFEDFKENGRFPDYWVEVPNEYMKHFRNDAILHPLCIVHQSCRDELAGKIKKGISFVHSIAVACRAGNGKVVYSDFGLQISEKTKEEIAKAIAGMACAFHVT